MVLDKVQDALFSGPLPDVRPSKAHPEHRAKRKQLEKESPAFSMQEFGIKAGMMALLAAVACFPWEKELEKHEKRKAEEEKKEGERDREKKGKDRGGLRGDRGGERRDRDSDRMDRRRDKEVRGERMRRYEDARAERRERKRGDRDRW